MGDPLGTEPCTINEEELQLHNYPEGAHNSITERLLTTVETKAVSVSLTERTLKSTARTFGDF